MLECLPVFVALVVAVCDCNQLQKSFKGVFVLFDTPAISNPISKKTNRAMKNARPANSLLLLLFVSSAANVTKSVAVSVSLRCISMSLILSPTPPHPPPSVPSPTFTAAYGNAVAIVLPYLPPMPLWKAWPRQSPPCSQITCWR